MNLRVKTTTEFEFWWETTQIFLFFVRKHMNPLVSFLYF